jgi:mono/diheme cytochrome c family protein
MGGGGGDTPEPTESAATPATTASAPTPAPVAPAPAAPAVPEAPAPVPPWVQAASQRKRIPYWAVPVLAMLPVWAVVYMLTLDKPTDLNSPVAVGADVYNTKGCSGCHGADGAGSAAIPALTGADGVLTEFPDPVDQVTWVALGSDGYKKAGITTLPGGHAVTTGMPAWETSLTPDELMSVVLHERSTLNAEEFDIAAWEEGFEEKVEELIPDQAAAYIEVLESWKSSPPTG